MKITATKFKDCYIVEPTIFADDRGCFFESFNKKKFNELTGIEVSFVQDNQSQSSKGTLRGLHFQKGVHAQAKLVRVLSGVVLDVVVDVRKESSTFGEHQTIVLSSENKRQLYIPKGFAHGFLVLSDQATFIYKCDEYYNKESEGGIVYKDQSLNINWEFPESQLILSKKDLLLPTLEEIAKSL